jgi:hypothetical protein
MNSSCDGEPAAHQLLSDEQQQHQHDGGFARRPGQRAEQVVRVLRQGGDQYQQRHHGQVLEQQDADDFAAVLAFQLQPLGQHLDHDGGGRHGQRAAQRERGLPANVHVRHLGHQQPAQPHGGDDGGRHLRHAQPEHDAAHGHQLGQREFQADREHQEHHPELGQDMAGFALFGQAQRVRPDYDAHRQIAQHGRQMQHPERDHAQHGAAQQQQGQF